MQGGNWRCLEGRIVTQCLHLGDKWLCFEWGAVCGCQCLALEGFFDDGVWVLGVFGPGAVVEAYVLCSGDFEAEGDDGGGDSGAAGRGDRLGEVDLFGVEEFA